MQSTLDFSVYLGSYQNIAANGSVCTGGCNNSFTFCLQEEFGGCDYGLINSSVIQSDDFIFDSALSELNISNPLLFNNIVPSTVRHSTIHVYGLYTRTCMIINIPLHYTAVLLGRVLSRMWGGRGGGFVQRLCTPHLGEKLVGFIITL